MVPSAPPMISTDVLWNSRAKKNQSVILRGKAIQTIFFSPQILIAKITLMPNFYIPPTLVAFCSWNSWEKFSFSQTSFRLLHLKTRLLQFNNWVELHQSPSMKSILSVQQEIHPSPLISISGQRADCSGSLLYIKGTIASFIKRSKCHKWMWSSIWTLSNI